MAIETHWKKNNRDAVTQFGNKMSHRQYSKQRLALHFESIKEARYRVISGENP